MTPEWVLLMSVHVYIPMISIIIQGNVCLHDDFVLTHISTSFLNKHHSFSHEIRRTDLVLVMKWNFTS